MPDQQPVQPLSAFTATLRPPGSKSLTNRALLLAALARGTSTLRDPLWADDTRRMVDALVALGVPVKKTPDGREVTVRGLAGFSTRDSAALDLGNAGTAMRSLTAACSLGIGRYRLDGDSRMRQRPIGELVDALRQLGASIAYDGPPGYPPLIVSGSGLAGGTVVMKPTLSSQFISALLMVGPYCRRPLTLHFDGPVTSRPYVEMTLNLMARFGIQCQVDAGFTTIAVPQGEFRGQDYAVEPDASNASYFLAAAALVPGSRCTIEGLGRQSLQGDVAFADVLHQMGAGLTFGPDFITIMAPPAGTPLQGFHGDLNHMPDMVQTLAAVALFAAGPTTIRNVGNLRVKETDRLGALKTELSKTGARVTINGDDLTIAPAPGDVSSGLTAPSGGFDTYNDHRMAMSLALIGLRLPGVRINNPACVAKTFPDYFEYLEGLGKR